MELTFLVTTRFLEMMAEVTLSWFLLDGAVIAVQKLVNLADVQDEALYQGKIAGAQYYINNILPGVKSKAEIIAKEDSSALDADGDIFLLRSDCMANYSAMVRDGLIILGRCCAPISIHF